MSEDEYTEAVNPMTIGDFKKQRGVFKSRLTLFEKYVSKFEGVALSERQRAEFELRVESVGNILKSFHKIQDRIEQMCDDIELELQLDYRESFEDQYFSIMSIAKCLLDVVDRKGSDESKCTHAQNKLISMKLPDIRLPLFDGSYDHWLEYKNSYQSMIHKRSDLDSIQKFHYLKSSLSGSALQVISALEFTAANYSHAWDLLENRYQNNRLLIHNHVKSLFTAPSINKESPTLIRRLIDVVLRNIRALNSLGEPTEGWDTLINYIIVSKLDSSTEREWENYKGSVSYDSHKGKVKLDDLLNFLRNRADMLDMIQNNYSKPTHTQNKPSSSTNKQPYNNSQVQQSHSFVSTRNNGSKSVKSTRACVVCGGNHPLYTCINFLNVTIQERIKLVEENKLCRNCLRAGHSSSECMFGPCKQCDKRHNSLLHIVGNNRASTPASSEACAHNSQPADRNPVSIASCAVNSLHAINNNSSIQLPQVLLSTALIEVRDNNNKYHTAKVLLDSGSQNCFISEKLRRQLNVSVIQSTIRISGVGQSVSQSNQLCDIHIRSKTNTYNTQLRCFVLPSITASIPSTYVDYNSLSIPDNVCLADPLFNVPSEIDLLIGADVFWDLLGGERRRLSNGPYLQSSKLGWFISGPIQGKIHAPSLVQCNFVQSSAIDTQLRNFWELEEVGKPCSVLTDEERMCEEHFVSTTKRDSDGRFSVRMPMKESADVLGDSYERAKSRFLSLERKLDRLPSYKRMYSDFMREYIDLGHMSLIDNYGKPYYFLPHHGVFREHSLTTKLRVVFDASAATTSNKSLNDIQITGPPLQNDITSILLRFRQHRYVACADVEKMFRQVALQENQRRLQLILWRENSSENLRIYQLNTVTYGTSSAPFLSMRCIKQLAKECDDDVIADVINSDIFVDDLITGHDDPLILSDICEKTAKVLKSGCFPLRKWTFNHDVNMSTSKELGIGDHCQNKTLGLGWQVGTDELHFTTHINNQSIVTKRSMISVISQIYDPLGLLSPIIIIAKIMLQKLWLSKIDWDDVVPIDVLNDWNRFIETLSHLGSLRVPRYVMSERADYRELHIFCDASQEAYGTCAYIRSYGDNTPVSVKLLCAKSKVAPVKTICTIPRLELCGALLGAKLYKKIINSLRVQFTKIFFWTDSTIVMGWLRMSPHCLKTFVQNRVSQINELTSDALWLHINSKDNPADIVSRGLYLNELKDNNMWWLGPEFLKDRDLTYSTNFSNNNQLLPEIKSQVVSMMCKGTSTSCNLIDFNRFSSFNRLRRAAAYVLRFIGNARVSKQHRKTGLLTVDEINASVSMLARLAQLESFHDEYNNLSKNCIIKSKRIIGLNVFLDNNKLIRVGGRIENSPIFDNNKKHPVLLCGKHRFTILLFQFEHKQLFHAGPQLLLSCVRETWWPLGGRDLARKTVHECVKCTRIKGKTLCPIMGNLPVERLEPGYPFMRCGVDYAGPVMLLNRKGRGATLKKGYICLFVCFSTRAVHLELVTSLSTDDYILALKRFIARRGKPAEIISDNGKNFVGADKEMLSLFIKIANQDVINYATDNNIKFTFIPPYCPHFGGLWEAGVKSCKYHLRRVIGQANLTYEEFSTVLVQTEAILNSRPLSALSTDPNDLLPLTPAHFLIGRPLTAPACEDLTATPIHRLARYGLIEKMRQDLWKRWSKEYVSELQTRTKWKTNKGEVKLNTLALIKDDQLPPLKWKLGRIVRVYPGADGVSRVADLRTSTGITRRGFSKICPLPVPPTDTEDSVTRCDPVGTC